ncbi:MAG: NepR family anti-sigma factor [Hyphomonas sp.]
MPRATEKMDEKKTAGRKQADTERKRRGDRLGEQLRRLYDDVTHESVPDDFLRLLEEADRARSADTSDKA